MSEPSSTAVEPAAAPAVEAAPRPKRMRVQAGLAFVQRVRVALYVLLVASAALAFVAGSNSGGPRMPAWLGSLAPVLFGAFLLIFAIYRTALVRARRYPASTGLFQIGLGALVFVMLLPSTRRAISLRARGQESGPYAIDDLASLMDNSDPRVRALAAEVAGTRAPGPRYMPALADRLDDPDAHVRAAARLAIIRSLGSDPGAGFPEDVAIKRLRAELSARGWLPAP